MDRMENLNMSIVRVCLNYILEDAYHFPLTWSTIGCVGMIVMIGEIRPSGTRNIKPLKLSEIALS